MLKMFNTSDSIYGGESNVNGLQVDELKKKKLKSKKI